MQEVGVDRCNMAPEMAKFNRIFEYKGRLICLPEAPGYQSGFCADKDKMCWITVTGVRTDMTPSEKSEVIRQLRKWNKSARRRGRLPVKVADTTKGFGAFIAKLRNKLSGTDR